jgi:hypothetical protein
MRYLVTVGYFDDSGEGRLLEIDLERGAQAVRFVYTPPEPLRVPEKGFTGAAWSAEPGASALLVCAPCAVHVVDPGSWSIKATWHEPCWNDLHHVAVAGDRVYVVNTGLESVDVLTLEGQFLGSHALHPGWLSAARQRGLAPERDALPALLDARWPSLAGEVASAAPPAEDDAGRELPFSRRKVRDYVHANHVAVHGGQILVTRFLDRAVDDVSSFRRVIADIPGLPHDGLVDGDRFWLTCIDGIVLAYAIEHGRVTGREVQRFDVFATGYTGWCRGLAVTPDHLVVGLTAIVRPPRYPWRDLPFEATETSVLAIERATGRLAWRVVIANGKRRPKIFTVLPLPRISSSSISISRRPIQPGPPSRMSRWRRRGA